ncbi:NAD(P)-binding class I SAM-dependent methyltransferase [Rathayibacter sp. CAU 1779]
MLDPEGPMGVEPRAMRSQAEQVVADLSDAGFLVPGMTVAEYSSPHSGDWADSLHSNDLRSAEGERADVVLDVFGLMHEPDQRAAFEGRVARLHEDGTLVVQIHSLEGDIRRAAWPVVRHGHYAYYTVTSLVSLFAAVGFVALDIFEYDLQGGTAVVVFRRRGEPSSIVQDVLNRERELGLSRADTLIDVTAVLREAADTSSRALRAYVDDCLRIGATVGAYPASTGSVALLSLADLGPDDVIAVGDMSVEKQGRLLPGSRIPIVTPDQLMDRAPTRILLFVPDLLEELREGYPTFEDRGGHWVVVAPYPSEVAQNSTG